MTDNIDMKPPIIKGPKTGPRKYDKESAKRFNDNFDRIFNKQDKHHVS